MGYREKYIMTRDSGYSSKGSGYSYNVRKRKAASFSPIDKPMTLTASTRTLTRSSLYSPKVFYVSPRKNVDILTITRPGSDMMTQRNIVPTKPESRLSFDSLDSRQLSPQAQVEKFQENFKFRSKFRRYKKSPQSTSNSDASRSPLRSPKKFAATPSSSSSYKRFEKAQYGTPRSELTSTVSVRSGSRSRSPLSSADCDSPPDWNQGQNPPPRMASPPPQEHKQEPNWLEPKRNSPPPAMPPPEHVNQTISPRYQDEQPSYRKEPVIRDPFRQLSSAEKRKKIDEFYVAEEDLAMARQRKEKEKYDKIEEQRKIRELQDSYKPWGRPGGGAPNRYDHGTPVPSHPVFGEDLAWDEMKYGDENRGMERRPMPERKEDVLRQQEQDIIDLRRSLNHLEREQRGNATPPYEPSNNRMEMLEDQAKMMKHLEGEIDRLRAQDDMAYRRGEDRQQYEPRAQSEPQTERMYNRRPNRDREIFGQSKQSVPEYLNVSPRRHPVGRLYNKDSTYKTDFDVPFGKHGPHNLGNPNKEPMEPYNPFGMEGGGAPMVDSVGQRRTRIAGSMGYLGRELSDSARARRAHKRELLQEIGEQAAFERARREREKAYNRQEFVEVADAIRQKKVGYPRFNQNGLISQHHHLPHMFNTVPYAERMEQKKYHDFLERQIEDRNAMTRIGQFEEQRQAKEHYRTIDGFFGRRGGGNVKGPDTRKINLDKAIHNPQSTSQYYNKVRLEEEMAPHEILNTFKPRITINSTHKNLYEYPQGELKTNYSGRTPYAAEF